MEDLTHLTSKTAFVPPGTRLPVLSAAASTAFRAAFASAGSDSAPGQTVNGGGEGGEAPRSAGDDPVMLADDADRQQFGKAGRKSSAQPLAALTRLSPEPAPRPSEDAGWPAVSVAFDPPADLSMVISISAEATPAVATLARPVQQQSDETRLDSAVGALIGSPDFVPFENGNATGPFSQADVPASMSDPFSTETPTQQDVSFPAPRAPIRLESIRQDDGVGLSAAGGAAVEPIVPALPEKGPVDGISGSVAVAERADMAPPAMGAHGSNPGRAEHGVTSVRQASLAVFGSAAPPDGSEPKGRETAFFASAPPPAAAVSTEMVDLAGDLIGSAVSRTPAPSSAAFSAVPASDRSLGVRASIEPPLEPIDGSDVGRMPGVSWVSAVGEFGASAVGGQASSQLASRADLTIGPNGLVALSSGRPLPLSGDGLEQVPSTPSNTQIFLPNAEPHGDTLPVSTPLLQQFWPGPTVVSVAMTALAAEIGEVVDLTEAGPLTEGAADPQVTDDGLLLANVQTDSAHLGALQSGAGAGDDAGAVSVMTHAASASNMPERNVPPPNPAPIARQVARALAEPSRDPGVPLDLTLDPPELGRLRLGFSEVNGVLTVTIAAERSDTADLIRRHVALLAEEFARAGLDAPSVDISHGGTEQRSHGRSVGLAMPDHDAAPVLDAPAPLDLVRHAGAAGLDLRL